MQERIEKQSQKSPITFSQDLKSLFENQNLFKCRGNNQAIYICSQKNCQKPALQCINKECQCQKQKFHQQCDSNFLCKILKHLLKKQKQIPQDVKQSFQQVVKMINKMIDQLSELRNKIESQQEYFGLFKEEIQFVQLLKENKVDQIHGKLIYDIKNILTKQVQLNFPSRDKFEKFFNEKMVNFQKICSQIENKYSIQSEEFYLFNESQILKQEKDIQLLTQWIKQLPNGFQKKKIQANLIFKASQHSFKLSQFHKYCDGMQNTIIIVKNQKDRIFGGYSHAKWSSNEEYSKDLTRKSFLFTLSPQIKEKINCKNYDQSIHVTADKKIQFRSSGWIDFQIVDCGNINNCYFGPFGNYDIRNVNSKYQNSNQTSNLMLGLNCWSFKVKQYEVYQIIGL